MPITDAQAEVLRAYLVGDWELYQQLFRELDRAEAGKEYSALVTAAFVEAVWRRFGKNYTRLLKERATLRPRKMDDTQYRCAGEPQDGQRADCGGGLCAADRREEMDGDVIAVARQLRQHGKLGAHRTPGRRPAAAARSRRGSRSGRR
jgi:hypothetical protein